MDILLIPAEGGAQLRPASIHGMLWLQTHFKDSDWDAIASDQVKLSLDDAKFLSKDAKQAGLNLNSLKQFSISEKF